MTVRETIVAASGTVVPEFAPEITDLESASVHQGIIARMRMQAGYEEPWHVALLHAVGQWTRPGEHVHGRYWHYVIGGEALDWLTLAQRLCLEIPDAVPGRELEALVFRGQLPERVRPERFRRLIGPYRYTALLNFHYGVTVEEALQLLTEEAIRKNRLACCYQDSDNVVEEAHRSLYGDMRAALARQFFDETSGLWGKDPESFSLPAWREFTYWLFKRRIRKWHPARVASDTRRSLELLRELQNGASICRGSGFIDEGEELVTVPASLFGGS